ncbi:cytolysin-activating lysine-acyltransferase [Aliiroseovarius sediminilitoris]|uniref:RTX toxin-activating lysine-acyltransferase n=1 Tax=Aliiroseovarius sediminilitoris TaxID=1173584 RepID=A0A1I0P5P2_9RHOB|nr:toxin-activating lysine-acyltransferase [Aliiroseovarius sediminilitoris]SEW09691.1 cytolysin-activating lysine-acyltransferase [Aliiroseovarius sediminilitoris]
MTKDDDTGGLIEVSPLYPNDDVLRVFGELAFLAFYSNVYGNWSARALAKAFEPPIYLKQFNIYRARDVPRGLVTWAKLDAAAEKKHLSGSGLDEFDEWRSGDQLWIMDIMAPWGHGAEIIENIKSTIQEDSVKTLRIHKGQKKILEWHRAPGSSKWKIRSTVVA